MKRPEPTPKKIFGNEESDISEIVKVFRNKDITESLAEIEREYPYWEKFRIKTKELNINSELYWSYIKTQRNRTAQTFNLLDKNSLFSFKFNTTPKVLKLLHEFDMSLGGNLDGGSIIPSEDKNRYLISSIMEEAIASSQLEGAVTSREVAKDMLRAQRMPKNVSEKMILNNYVTIKRITELKGQPLTIETILELHSLISKDTLQIKANEGAFRKNNDIKIVEEITNEIFYTPPDYKILPELMEEFCAFGNDKDDKVFIHPIIRGIILHFLIGYIHPFVDGNGRTARTIFYWYLINRGYWLIEYMTISKAILNAKSQYARAYLFCEEDENDLTYFIDYNLNAMNKAYKSLYEYINRKITEKKEFHNLLKFGDLNERQMDILKDFITDPHKSLVFKEVLTKYDVAYQTARTDLLDLEEKKFLVQKKMKNKIFFVKSDQFEEKIKSMNKN